MAFKSMREYTEERTGDFFLLRNDGDFADVAFLYRDYNDVMAASVHYIKSPEYSGYVHCVGRGCPACARNIRVQNKLFIPMYVFSVNGEPVNKISFWDRNVRFNQILMDKVFTNYPNASAYVFRITRKGVAGDVNTTYDIMLQAVNNSSYDDILASCQMSFPESYALVCRDITAIEMTKLFNSSQPAAPEGSADLPSYSITPRVSASTATPSIAPPVPLVPSIDAPTAADGDIDPESVDPIF